MSKKSLRCALSILGSSNHCQLVEAVLQKNFSSQVVGGKAGLSKAAHQETGFHNTTGCLQFSAYSESPSESTQSKKFWKCSQLDNWQKLRDFSSISFFSVVTAFRAPDSLWPKDLVIYGLYFYALTTLTIRLNSTQLPVELSWVQWSRIGRSEPELPLLRISLATSQAIFYFSPGEQAPLSPIGAFAFGVACL